MAWSTVTPPVTATAISTSTFGTPVSGNMAIIGGAWTSYTPTLTNITKGNGTVVAAYKQIDKTIKYRFQFAAGSTTTYSAGTLAVSLPVAAHVDYTANGNWAVGSAFIWPTGATAKQGGTALITASGTTLIFLTDDLATNATATNLIPGTWGTGAQLSFTIEYEAA